MFRYRLQRILELRRTEVDRLRLDVAETQRQLHAATQRIERLRQERDEHDRRCRDEVGRTLTVLELRGRVSTSQALAERERVLATERERFVEELETRRDALLEAHRKVRALERLREKKLEAYRGEIEAQERRMLDDIRGRTGDLRPSGSASPAPGSR